MTDDKPPKSPLPIEVGQPSREATPDNQPTGKWQGYHRPTPEERALQPMRQGPRKPWMCSAHISDGSGDLCTRARVKGAAVCPSHGASAPHIKRAAQRRLLELVEPTMARMEELSKQSDHLPTARHAAKDLLDRAGVGENLKTAAQKGTTAVQVVFGSGMAGALGIAVKTIPADDDAIEGDVVEEESE